MKTQIFVLALLGLLFVLAAAAPTSDLKTPTSDLKTPTSDLKTPTSDLKTPTSDPKTPTSDLKITSDLHNARALSIQCIAKDLTLAGLFFEPSSKDVSRAQTTFWTRCGPNRNVGTLFSDSRNCLIIHSEKNLIITVCPPGSPPGQLPFMITYTCDEIRRALMDIVANCTYRGKVSGILRLDGRRGTATIARRRE